MHIYISIYTCVALCAVAVAPKHTISAIITYSHPNSSAEGSNILTTVGHELIRPRHWISFELFVNSD